MFNVVDGHWNWRVIDPFGRKYFWPQRGEKGCRGTEIESGKGGGG